MLLFKNKMCYKMNNYNLKWQILWRFFSDDGNVQPTWGVNLNQNNNDKEPLTKTIFWNCKCIILTKVKKAYKSAVSAIIRNLEKHMKPISKLRDCELYIRVTLKRKSEA